MKLAESRGGGATATCLVLVAVWVGVDESVTVSIAVNVWALVKMWVAVRPGPTEPSPKFQLTVYGPVPPLVEAVKVTWVFTTGFAGDTVKLVVRGGGTATATDFELVAVWAGDDESVAVAVTVKV